MKIRTHTFNGRKYRIELVDRIDGVTDVPGEAKHFEMLILAGNGLKALHSAIHEGMEAIREEGTDKDWIHNYDSRTDGNAATWDVARFLWRLGYRRK